MESQRTIAFVIIVGVSNKSGSVIAGMVAQLITEWWLSCTGQGAQRAPDSSEIIEIQNNAKKQVTAAQAACKQEIDAIKTRHASEIATIKKDYEKQIKETKEAIENRKEILLKMDEKELLADVMIALDGYSGRFERIEKFLTEDVIRERIDGLYQKIESELNEIAQSFTLKIEEMNNAIDSKLDNSVIQNGLNSIEDDVSEINSTVDSISSTVDEIHSSVCDKYSYDSLASEVESLKSSIEEAATAAEEAKSAAESVQYMIESQN